MRGIPNRRVYVIRLDAAVLGNRKFAQRNEQYQAGKPCVYVGSTSLSPEERFKKHKDGIKANRFVRDFGLYLMKRVYQKFPPQTWPEILKTEKLLAERLRRKSYAVWQG